MYGKRSIIIIFSNRVRLLVKVAVLFLSPAIHVPPEPKKGSVKSCVYTPVERRAKLLLWVQKYNLLFPSVGSKLLLASYIWERRELLSLVLWFPSIMSARKGVNLPDLPLHNILLSDFQKIQLSYYQNNKISYSHNIIITPSACRFRGVLSQKF